MKMLILFVLAGALLCVATPAGAQTTATTVEYPAGWNMVGGPPGTSSGGAAAFVTYGPAGYAASASTISIACGGAWAYFFHSVTLTLPTGAASPETCALNAGWTLVGDPFATPASLPSGTAAFYWDASSDQYVPVAAIAPGTSAWVYSSVATTIQLTTPQTIYITGALASGPYTVHVGDSIELLVPNANPVNATADPSYLQLQAAGLSGDMSCVAGQPDCQVSLINEFWRWTALRTGSTTVNLTPTCATAVPACTTPSQQIQITIEP